MTESSTGANSTSSPESAAARVVRGALGGVVAGAVFIVFNMWFSASNGGPATAPFRLISSLVLGSGSLEAGTTNVALGVLVHAVISVLFGVVFAFAIAPRCRTNGTVAVAGGVFGLLVYVLDFLILANTVFPQFQMPNDPLELAAHIVFGHVLATFFYSSGVRAGEPAMALTAG